MLFPARVFHKNSLIVACCIFRKLEIRTLTPNRFKNQANDTLELLDCNSNAQQGFVKQKMLLIITLDNGAIVNTLTFGPMLFQFCVTTAILIKFTQNSNLYKSVSRKLLLKTTMMKSNFFLFNKFF